ncbi:hypothetical protein SKAU_G00038110 [Synaphobranchus kaupii]|uniref:Hemogen n=1 Tax=Synaphobranchus kaupii TaxID=118154 RepID=A0A9Q1GGG4_SYNKA|nr:hypothetical protein SKAU_G00038110 [Synaphobranchus kaupii]
METLGKDTTQVECKQPDDNQGGILRRLRDRNLLKKRRAEAEEKAIYQVQSKRRKVSQDRKGGPGRKGRPKKSEASVLPQPPQEGAPQDGSTEEEPLQGAVQSQAEEQLTQDPAKEDELPQGAVQSQAEEQLTQDPAKEDELPQGAVQSQAKEQLTQDPAKEEEPVTSDADKADEPLTANIADAAEEPPADTINEQGESLLPLPLPPTLSQPLESPLALPAPPAPEPQSQITPLLTQEEDPQGQSKSGLPAEEVPIEDLGPDGEAEPSPPRKLVMERGTNEEPGDNMTDSVRVFPISTVVSPPQLSYLPGPSL